MLCTNADCLNLKCQTLQGKTALDTKVLELISVTLIKKIYNFYNLSQTHLYYNLIGCPNTMYIYIYS